MTLRSAGFAKGERQRQLPAMVIAFVSAKGGAGKTVTAASLGRVLAAIGQRTLLIDTDAATNGLTLLYIDHVVEAKSEAQKQFRIWDVTSGEEVAVLLGHTDGVSALALGRIGSREVIVSGSADRTLRIWEAASGEQLGAPLTGHTDGVSAVALGRIDGREMIVSGSADRTVRIWDAASGKEVSVLSGHTDGVSAVALGGVDGREIIVSGSADRTVRIWDAASGKEVAVLSGHTDGVSAVALGRVYGREIIVSGSADRTVRTWDATSGEEVAVLRGHAAGVSAVALGRVGGREIIVSGSADRMVRVWDTASGERLSAPLVGHAGRVSAVALGRIDGREVIVSGSDDRTVRIWDATSGEQLGTPLASYAGVSAVALGGVGGRDVIISGSNDATPLAGIFDESTTAPRPLPIGPLLDLIPATYVMRQTEGMNPIAFEAVLTTALARYRSEYDFIIIDAQAGSDIYALAAIGRSDRTVIVSEYDPVSAEGVERLRYVAKDSLTYERTWVLLNKVLPEFARGIGSFLEVARYLPPIPWDADVIRAFARRELAVDDERPNSYTLAMVEVARSLVGRLIEAPARSWLEEKDEAIKAPLRSRLEEIEEELQATERALVDTEIELRRRSQSSPLSWLQAIAFGIIVITGGLLADLTINVVTGGSLPGPLARFQVLAWPVLGVLFVATVTAALRERLRARDPAESRDISVERLALQRRLDELRELSAKNRTLVEAETYLRQ